MPQARDAGHAAVPGAATDGVLHHPAGCPAEAEGRTNSWVTSDSTHAHSGSNCLGRFQVSSLGVVIFYGDCNGVAFRIQGLALQSLVASCLRRAFLNPAARWPQTTAGTLSRGPTQDPYVASILIRFYTGMQWLWKLAFALRLVSETSFGDGNSTFWARSLHYLLVILSTGPRYMVC